MNKMKNKLFERKFKSVKTLKFDDMMLKKYDIIFSDFDENSGLITINKNIISPSFTLQNEFFKICLMYFTENRIFYYTISNMLINNKKLKKWNYIENYVDDIYMEFITYLSMYLSKFFIKKKIYIDTTEQYQYRINDLYYFLIYVFTNYKIRFLKYALSKFSFLKKHINFDYYELQKFV